MTDCIAALVTKRKGFYHVQIGQEQVAITSHNDLYRLGNQMSNSLRLVSNDIAEGLLLFLFIRLI